jgi:hypothetical protein
MLKVIEVMASIPRDTIDIAFKMAFNRIEAVALLQKKNSNPSVHFQKFSLKFIEKLQFYSISFGNIFDKGELAYAS